MTLPNRCRSAAENWLDTKGLIPCLLRECAEALEAAERREATMRAALRQIEWSNDSEWQADRACADPGLKSTTW